MSYDSPWAFLDDWLLGLVLLAGSFFAGSVVATGLDALADTGDLVSIGAFVLTAVVTFLLASFVLSRRSP